ncbi:endonuclease/exonuclease/phosphatase family protein [Deinococcus lacus]|uniref:Endonuclease/exonuclease/phosphatase family protein n=1 Tax=Deinococcus lacus TaxID=392561 RepID=A0ABW1YB10_9DEIO
MTYNIRYDNPEDPFRWEDRQRGLAELVRQSQPDVLGVQEALSHQVTDLATLLPGYQWVGQGRGPDNPRLKYSQKSGEWNPIFYKSNLTLLGSGTFWLSENPQQAGSFGPQFSLPRIATWAKFRLPGGSQVLAVNTHFPHESQARQQRAYAAQVLVRELGRLRDGLPVVLLGDFNMDVEDSAEPAATLLREHFHDAGAQAPAPTFYGFEAGTAPGVRLDYIWTAGAVTSPAQVLTARQGSHFFSDHLPVVADVLLR